MSNTLQSNRPQVMALCVWYVFYRNIIYPILDHLTKLWCEAFNLVASLLPLLLWACLRYFLSILNWGLGLWDVFWQDMKVKLKKSKTDHRIHRKQWGFLYLMRLPFSSPDFWSFSKCKLCDSKCWKRCTDYCLISLFAGKSFFGWEWNERGNDVSSSSFLPPLPLMLTLDYNFSPSFLYFLKSVVVTEKILSDRWPEKLSVLKFHLELGPWFAELHYGTLSQFCPTFICDLVIAEIATLNNPKVQCDTTLTHSHAEAGQYTCTAG